MSNIKKASLEEIRILKDAGQLRADGSTQPGEDLPDDFWADATLRMPEPKKAISLRVDPDILAFFKSQGEGHLTRMHAVLRAYVDAKRRQDAQ